MNRAEPRPSDVVAGVLSAIIGVSTMVLVTLVAGPSSEASASPHAATETPRPPAETVAVSIIDASVPVALAGPAAADPTDPPPHSRAARAEPTASLTSPKPTPRSRRNAVVPTPEPSGDAPVEPAATEPVADVPAASDAPPGDASSGGGGPGVGDEGGGGGGPAGDGSGGGEGVNPAVTRYRNDLREWLGERFSVRGTGLPASVLRSRRIAATIRIDGDRTIIDASAKPTGDTGFDEATAVALDHLRGQQLPATPDDYPGPLQATIRITFVCPVGACS